MKLSNKAQQSLDKVIQQFKTGDLSPIVDVVRFPPLAGVPSAKWSLGNQVMAYIQTGTLDCRGFRQWQQVGRKVKKGEKAAWILGPVTRKKEDDNGEEVMAVVGFTGISVFGAEQTEGEPLDYEIDRTPRQLPPLADVAARLGVTVKWQSVPADRLGDYNPLEDEIRMGTAETAVFFHELAHAAHYRVETGISGRGKVQHKEVVAEFTACVLMALYGIRDHTGNAWEYLSSYSEDPLTAITKGMAAIEGVIALLTNPVVEKRCVPFSEATGGSVHAGAAVDANMGYAPQEGEVVA